MPRQPGTGDEDDATTGAAFMSRAVVAVDLGGTRIKAARVTDDDGTPVVSAAETVDAPRDLDGALAVLAPLLSRLGSDCAGVGLGVPGLVRADGIIQALPGKYDGIVGFDLPAWLRTQVDGPSVVVNDAVAYAMGEATWGAGRGAERVLVVTIGTGFGAAVIDQGRPISLGPFGGGIMGGNVLIGDEGSEYADTAGHRGTIEAHCRADRIVDYARAAGVEVDDVRGVYRAVAAGDRGAQEAIALYQSWLAHGIAALAVAHGADRVVVGGGPAGPEAPWWPGLEELVLPRLWPSHQLSVVPSALGDAAANVGLAQLARMAS
jgi:glucokinase